MMVANDIKSRLDLELLIHAFYEKALPDKIIGYFFTDIAQIDISLHLPKIINFWDRQLFGNPVYHGQPFQVHKRISLKAEMNEHHFHRWQTLFCQTVDELFKGENAEIIKQKAIMIAEKMTQTIAAEQKSNDERMLRGEVNLGVQYFDAQEKSR